MILRILKRIFFFYFVFKKMILAKICFIFQNSYSDEKFTIKMSICIKIFYFQTKLLRSGLVANGKKSLVLASKLMGN